MNILFWIANYILYHLIHLMIIFVSNYPAYTLIVNLTNENNTLHMGKDTYKSSKIVLIFIYILPFLSILFTYFSDKQLKEFRLKREHNRVLNRNNTTELKYNINCIYNGLWKYSRHPNYLGEILYFVSLHLIELVSTNDIKCYYGIISIMSMFLTASIPMMEEKLLNKYGKEYSEYKKDVCCLISIKAVIILLILGYILHFFIF